MDLTLKEATNRLTWYGYKLTPWQAYLLSHMLDASPYVHRKHDRQVGGTYVAEARIILGLLEGERIVYAGQLQDCSRVVMRNVFTALDKNEGFRAYFGHGKQRIESNNGGYVRFMSLHGRQSGRGMSADLVIVDAPQVRASVFQDIAPVLSAVHNGKMIWLQSVDLNAEV